MIHKHEKILKRPITLSRNDIQFFTLCQAADYPH